MSIKDRPMDVLFGLDSLRMCSRFYHGPARMMSAIQSAFLCVLFVALALITGCSGQVKMGGKVTYSDSGEPLTTGTVVFKTETFQARGEIRPDGTYEIGSYRQKDGLPKNTYQVYVTGAFAQEDGPNGAINEFPLIDVKYANPAHSGLTALVDGSTHRFDFQVDRAKRMGNARKEPNQ